MQLDKTHIKIRVRTLSEVGDLTLVLLRSYPAALFVMFSLGAFAWVLLDFIALAWIPIHEAQFDLLDEEAQPELMRYVLWMMTLVFLQAPAAGVMATTYLGLAVFEQRPTLQNVWTETRRLFGRWFWKLGVVRMAFPPVIVLMARWGQPASIFWDVALPLMLILYAVVIRSSRPFWAEILLLEQCPLRGDATKVITASRRSKSLHSPLGSDLSGRFVTVSSVLVVMLFSITFSFSSLIGVLTGHWSVYSLVMLLGVLPAALWTVAGLSVFVRLLNYLDCRIRLEGWEVELAVRAEAIRQFGEDAGMNPAPQPEIDAGPPNPNQPDSVLTGSGLPGELSERTPPDSRPLASQTLPQTIRGGGSS